MNRLKTIKTWFLSSELMMTAPSVRRYGVSKSKIPDSAAIEVIETLN